MQLARARLPYLLMKTYVITSIIPWVEIAVIKISEFFGKSKDFR